MFDVSAPILALDLGTTAVKGARYTLRGEQAGPVAEVRHRVDQRTSVDLDRLLHAALTVLTQLPVDGVRVIATSAVWQSLVLIDRDGRANPRAATWETPQPSHVMSIAHTVLDPVWDADATGAYVHSSYPLLTAAGRDTVRESVRLQDLGGWVIETLTGARVGWSESIAAGSGMWDRHARRWNGPVAARSGVHVQLESDPPFVEPVRTTAKAHPALPAALQDAVWLPPLPDGLGHNLGVGALDDVLAATVGTSGSIRAVVSDTSLTAPDGLWAYRCGDRTLALGGAISSAGNLLEWVEEFTGRPIDWAGFGRVEPALPTLSATPDVFGRRGPDYPNDATGLIAGIRPEHTLGDLTAAFAIDMWASYALLLSRYAAERPVTAVRAGGGVIERHPFAAQVLADALDRPVELCPQPQPALRGAALLGSLALADPDGIATVDDVVAAIRSGELTTPASIRVVDPRPSWAQAMAERWQIAATATAPPVPIPHE